MPLNKRNWTKLKHWRANLWSVYWDYNNSTKRSEIDWLICFNGVSTRLGLFYTLKLGNRIYCIFIVTFFCVVVSWEFFLTVTYQVFLSNTNNLHRFIGIVGRVFANGSGDLGSIPGRIIPKTLKMVLDTSLLNTLQYKVCIKGKVEQFRERSSTLP